MKMIPIFLCSNMKSALAFYTRVLDFTLKNSDSKPDDVFVTLVLDDLELMLTTNSGDQQAAINVLIAVPDIDKLYRKYIKRGLKTSHGEESPVHLKPIDQTWGTREFYVTDLDGNTLRFFQSI